MIHITPRGRRYREEVTRRGTRIGYRGLWEGPSMVWSLSEGRQWGRPGESICYVSGRRILVPEILCTTAAEALDVLADAVGV